MRYIIELGNKRVPVVGAAESASLYYLRAEVSEDEHGRLVWSNKDGTNQKLEFVHRYLVTGEVVNNPLSPRIRSDATYFASATSNSTMTRSVTSGIWWPWQNPK